MRIAVRQAERCAQRPGKTVIGISQTASPQMISFEKMEKVVVMDAIIACQGDVMVSRYALTQLQTRHHNGIIKQFDMADTGKRKLLRQIASEKLTARRIQIRIRYLLSNQDPPIKCGQQTKARRNRTDGLNTQTKFGERRPTVVSDKVVRMKRIIGHDGNPARREITPVKALKVCRDDMISTADDYLNESRFFDYQLMSTLGYDEDSVDCVAEALPDAVIEGYDSYDVLVAADDSDLVYKALSISENINKPELLAGRMPQSADECLIDKQAVDTGDGSVDGVIGSVVTISKENSGFSVMS